MRYPSISEKPRVNIGDMRHRVTFQGLIKTPDGYKGNVKTWQDVITVWAQVIPITGREYFYAHQIKNEITHRVRIRYRTDINVEMRVLFGERVFTIESIIDIGERREYMEIRCMEGK